MFPNQNSQPKPVSQYVNINPDAGATPTPTPPTNPYPSQPEKVSFTPEKNSGKFKSIFTLILALTTVIFAGLFIWKYLDWSSINGKVDKLVNEQVAEKELEIKDKYAAELEEVEKNPPLEFAGPEDYGDLHFEYPRTWSFYITNDASDNQSDYEAYMHPTSIGPITDATIFALRINIIKKQNYEEVVVPYNKNVSKGIFTHNIITINSDKNYADVYEGTLENGKEVKIAIFKIRDKTVILRTDATRLFTNDFNKVLNSITFKE